MDVRILTESEMENMSKEQLEEAYRSLAASYKKDAFCWADIDTRFKKQQHDFDTTKKTLKEAQDTIIKLTHSIYGINVVFGKKQREKLGNLWEQMEKSKNSVVAKAQLLVEAIDDVFQEISEEQFEYIVQPDNTEGKKGEKTPDPDTKVPVEAEKDADQGEPENKDSNQSEGPAKCDTTVIPDQKEEKPDPSAQTTAEEKEPATEDKECDSPTAAKSPENEDEAKKAQSEGESEQDEGKRSEGQAKESCDSNPTKQENPDAARTGAGPEGESDQKDGDGPKGTKPEGNDQKGQTDSKTAGEPDPSDEKKPDQGDAKPQKTKGNKNLKRKPNFLLSSFFDVENLIVEIDPIYWGLPDVMKQLDTDEIEKIRLSADVQTYLNAKCLDGRYYPVLHISLKFRNGDNAYRNPHKCRTFRSSISADDVIATLAAQKYNLGLPLNRIEEHILKHANLNLSRSTIENWFRQVYVRGLKIFKYAMLDYLNSLEILIVDETYIICKDSEGNSYYWGICTTNLDPEAIPMCLFLFDESRSSLVPNHYLHYFNGTAVVDGFGAYPAFEEAHKEQVKLANCWKHWRSYLAKCLLSEEKAKQYEKINNGDAHWTVKVWRLTEDMFAKEQEFRLMTPEDRLSKRKEETYSMACEIESLLKYAKENDLNYHRFKETTEAIDYFLNRRDNMFRIFEDGRIPMTTNELETRNCLIALGRNNWMTVENALGGEISGMFHSMSATARMAGLDANRYFNYILESVPHILSMYTDEQLQEIVGYIDEYEAFLAKAHEGKRKKENKLFHPENMVHKKPDLSPFYVLFPNSDEQKAYFAIAEKEEEEQHEVISLALSLHNLSKSPLTNQQMSLILNTLQERVNKGILPNSFRKALDSLQQAVKEQMYSHPVTPNQLVDYIDTLLPGENDSEDEKARKAVLLSEENIEAFLDIKRYIQEKWYVETPDEDVYSTSNFTFPDDDLPEYLVNPTDILERYKKTEQSSSAEETATDSFSAQASTEPGDTSAVDPSAAYDPVEGTPIDPSTSDEFEANEASSKGSTEASDTNPERPVEAANASTTTTTDTTDTSEGNPNGTTSGTADKDKAGPFSGDATVIPPVTSDFKQSTKTTTAIDPSPGEAGQGTDFETEEERGKPPS